MNLTYNEIKEIIDKYQKRCYELKEWGKKKLEETEDKYYLKIYDIFSSEYNLLQDILRDIEQTIELKQIK